MYLSVHCFSAEGNIIRRTLLSDGTEQVVATPIASNVTNDNACASPLLAKQLLEKKLIEEIRQRPPLWNFKLPLAERGLRVKDKLWEEVAQSLDGKIILI